jgi:hypothetical protein
VRAQCFWQRRRESWARHEGCLPQTCSECISLPMTRHYTRLHSSRETNISSMSHRAVQEGTPLIRKSADPPCSVPVPVNGWLRPCIHIEILRRLRQDYIWRFVQLGETSIPGPGTRIHGWWLATVQRRTCSPTISPSAKSGKDQHVIFHMRTFAAEYGAIVSDRADKTNCRYLNTRTYGSC